jgi:hypothetical protein
LVRTGYGSKEINLRRQEKPPQSERTAEIFFASR